MFARVAAAIEKHRLLTPGDHVAVAVSGGADSVALLHAMARLRARLAVRVTAVHLDHGLRGRDAQDDARFVAELARRLGVPCVTGHSDVRRLAARRGWSLEMAGREARYRFLARTVRGIGASCVATAHTADDQAETLLLRLARGAGARGLGGIARETVLHGVRIVRPLLEIRRADIEAFLRRGRRVWREDASNRDLSFLRNRVRHVVLPALEQHLNPKATDALARAATILQDEDAWLSRLAEEAFRVCRRPAEGEAGIASALDVASLRDRPPACIRRVLHVWLRSAGVDADLVDCRVLNRLLDMAQNGIGRCVAVGGARQVVCVSGCLRLRTDVPERAPTPFRSVVRVPGETIVAGLRIVTEWRTGLVREKGRFPGALPARASLRRDAVLRRLVVVRSWQPGDRMAPLGMNGSKKLHDIFVDGKIPRSERHSVPIFECRGQIAWLPGYRVARGYDVAQPEDVALHIRVERT